MICKAELTECMDDRDTNDISIVQGWTTEMLMASPSFTVGRQGCFSIATVCKKVRAMPCVQEVIYGSNLHETRSNDE
jgi:hypothetical protein